MHAIQTRHNALLGRMSTSERALGRFMRSPDGHADAPPAAAVADTVDAPAADVVDTPAADAVADTSAAADGADVGADDSSILGDAASPGGGVEGAEGEGSTDEAEAASGDAADAEVEPYAGLEPPEGFEAIDTDALAAATPLMRAFGVPDEKAQDFINQAAPVIGGLVDKAVAATLEGQVTARADMVKGWAEELRADPELGGSNYDKTVALAAQAKETFFPGEEGGKFREFLAATGLGNHPQMVKGFAAIGAAIADGAIHLGSAETAARTTAQKLYDPVFQAGAQD